MVRRPRDRGPNGGDTYSIDLHLASDHDEKQVLLQVDASIDISNCTLALMNASLNDSAADIRRASVMGFVYISDVDSTRRRLKVLAPISGRLSDRPMIWGRWPEPLISLVG
jgi:polyribonucleotide 5'-hydroxyl-kinase